MPQYTTSLDNPHDRIFRLYDLVSGSNPNGLIFSRGALHSGARIHLKNGVDLDILWGMASKDMMDRFVMGVYLPTANHTLITDKHSGIETKLRDGGVYPVYADLSDPTRCKKRAQIRFGADLLRLTKDELKSITEVVWDWNKHLNLRRPCGMGAAAADDAAAAADDDAAAYDDAAADDAAADDAAADDAAADDEPNDDAAADDEPNDDAAANDDDAAAAADDVTGVAAWSPAALRCRYVTARGAEAAPALTHGGAWAIMCSFRCYWRRRGSRLRGGRFKITNCTPRAMSISY